MGLKCLAAALVGSMQEAAIAQGASASVATDTERAETAVRKFWDAFNRAAWAELDDLVTPGYAHHPPGKTLTLADFKAGGAWVHKALAAYRLTIDTMLATDRDVATELSVVQEGVPAVIPVEMCYLGWQESLAQLALLVEPQIPE